MPPDFLGLQRIPPVEERSSRVNAIVGVVAVLAMVIIGLSLFAIMYFSMGGLGL